MEILCLMGLFPKEYEKEINEKSSRGVQNAANKLQWGIVQGLSDQPDVNVTIFNSLYIGSYPKRYKDLYIPSFNFAHREGANDKNIGYTNLSVFKTFSRYHTLKKEIKRWLDDHQDKEVAVVAYAMTSPFVELLNFISKKYPKVKTCLIVPDLPEYMNATAQSSIIYSTLKKVQIRHFKRELKSVNGYVLLTKYMAEWFDWDIKYTVVEGISLKTKADLSKTNNVKKEKSILYAGLLEEKYGVIDLVNSFIEIDDDEWVLDLFGSGSALEQIKRIATNHKNINVHGRVPNSEVLEYQKRSSILVNPRNDNNTFTKYSFPSKIIEYMGSGTPMVAYKLAGMPDEYTEYFYVVEPIENGLQTCMRRVMSLSDEDRNQMGMNALAFIVREKSAKKQGEKIVELLQSL